MEIEGAFNSLTLRLGPVEEDDVRVYLSGAFNDYRLEVPDSTPVRVRSRGFMTRQRGRREPSTSGRPGYRVYLDGAFSQVDVYSD